MAKIVSVPSFDFNGQRNNDRLCDGDLITDSARFQFLGFGRVMNSGRVAQHWNLHQSQRYLLQKRAPIFDAPLIQYSEWPDNVRHAAPARGRCRRSAAKRKERVNVNEVVAVHAVRKPPRQRP